MSRLDDELKIAFSRREPPAGFAERVLERAARPARQKESFWQSLLSIFQQPRARWVAVGVAASLLVLIGALQLRNVQQVADDRRVEQAIVTPPAPENRAAPDDRPQINVSPGDTSVSAQPVRRAALRKKAPKTQPRDDEQKVAGEEAKQRLMMALHIASTTLNEAQKAIRGTSEPRPAPANNR